MLSNLIKYSQILRNLTIKVIGYSFIIAICVATTVKFTNSLLIYIYQYIYKI